MQENRSFEQNREPGAASAAELRQEDLARRAQRPGNEAWRVSRLYRLGMALGLMVAGMVAATIFPPLEWSWLAWAALMPLMAAAWQAVSWKAAWRCGFYWGYGFSLCSFFWLREIEGAIPFALAAILALFPAFWAAAVPALRWYLLVPQEVRLKGEIEVKLHMAQPVVWYREFPILVALAAWWCVLEWVRSWVGTGLPWNYLAASQWQNIVLVQVVEYTGVYGVSFMVALVNFALMLTGFNMYYGMKQGRMPRPVSLVLALTLVVAALIAGLQMARRALDNAAKGKQVTLKIAALQGDISQRRNANERLSKEALDKYLALSERAAAMKPDLMIWPETAVPDPFRSYSPVGNLYREGVYKLLQQYQIPILLGSIDFEPAAAGGDRMDIVNSALLFRRAGELAGKYSKIHIVPFGEFIPFRAWLPKPVIRMIDMGRDLSRGRSFMPLEVYSGVWAGINICFEDVFDYISRREAQLGANMLLVITNDAWYPTSAEPEQHLANSVFRAIETRLPLVRCGNNSASCLIRPDGVIADMVFKHQEQGVMIQDYRRHGEGIGFFTVTLRAEPEMTFFARYGNVFILFCAVVFGFAMLAAMWQWRQQNVALGERFEDENGKR